MKTFGLSKSERIKSKNEFALIYSSGKSVNSHSQKLKAIYIVREANESGLKAAFVVFKKAGKAVWRNRIKRLLREAYRLNKYILLDTCKEKNIEVLLSLSVKSLNEKKNKKVVLEDLSSDVVDLMNKIKSRL